MKKHFLLLLVVLPLGISILGGCGGAAEPDVASNTSTAPGEKPEGQR